MKTKPPSSAAKTKTLSVTLQDDQVIGIEIDGVHYDSIDQIPDDLDRQRVIQLEMNPPEEQELAPRKREKPMSFLFLLFLGISLLLMVIAAGIALLVNQQVSLETSAPGRVVEMQLRNDGSGSTYGYPIVELSLPDGEHQTIIIGEGSWPPAYQVGQKVQVRYNPEKILEARIASGSNNIMMYLGAIITGGLGLIFFGVSFFVRWILQATNDIGDVQDLPEPVRPRSRKRK